MSMFMPPSHARALSLLCDTSAHIFQSVSNPGSLAFFFSSLFFLSSSFRLQPPTDCVLLHFVFVVGHLFICEVSGTSGIYHYLGAFVSLFSAQLHWSFVHVLTYRTPDVHSC